MMKKLLLLVALVATTLSYGQSLTNAIVPVSAELGETITISFDFTTDGTKLANKAYITLYQGVPGVTDPAPGWTYGKQPVIEPNATSGSVSVTNFTIPTTVDDTLDWFIRVTYTHADGSWYSTPFEQAIDLTPAPISDSVAFAPENPTFEASSSIDIDFTYTSDTDIAVNGLKLTYWTTITDPSYCDAWRGQALNTTILPAGEDMTGTMTITNFDAAVSTDGVLMTTDELNTNQVNSSEGDYPGASSVHFWQLRLVDNDANDDFSISALLNTMVITASTASIEDVALNHIKVYPNPTGDFIHISDLTDIETISIHNVLGKEVKSFKAQKTIDISNLSTGIYYLQTNNGLKRKIIKQ